MVNILKEAENPALKNWLPKICFSQYLGYELAIHNIYLLIYIQNFKVIYMNDPMIFKAD